MDYNIPFIHFSHLKEELGLSALLKGTLTHFSPSLVRDSNQQSFGYWPNTFNQDTASTGRILQPGLNQVAQHWNTNMRVVYSEYTDQNPII